MTSNPNEALAAEVRAEMSRRRLTARSIQQKAGVSQSAWGNYFVQASRDIPVRTLLRVAAAIGVPASELVARAEEAMAADPGLPEDYALAAHTGERQQPFDSQVPADE